MLEHPAITRMMSHGIEYDYIATCRCGNEIQRGELHFISSDNEAVCEDCMRDIINLTRIDILAELLGYETEGETI